MEGVFLMPRGRKVNSKKTSNGCLLTKAASEFYLNNQAKGLAEATQQAYKDYVTNFINWCGADTVLDEITPQLLDVYLKFKDDKGVKKVSQATAMNHLRRFFRFCVSRGFMDEIEITIPKYEKTIKEPYSEAEMKVLLEKPVTNNWVEWRNWCLVNYFFATGQRLSTVLNLKKQDLDLENGRVTLRWNKDKMQKVMPLSKAVIKVLKEYIVISDLGEEEFLFPEYEGGRLKKRSAEESIANYNKSRGVDKTSIHLFRHTFAKNYILNGGSPVKLQKLLNHKTMEMTMKYVNLYGTDLATDFEQFNPLDNLQKDNKEGVKRKMIKCIG